MVPLHCLHEEIRQSDYITKKQPQDKGSFQMQNYRKITAIIFILIISLALLFPGTSIARVEQNSDLLGHNLKSFTLRTPDFRLCQQACEQNQRCKAATYVKPGVQGPQARCYLKHTLVPRQENSCCTTWIADSGTSTAISGAAQIQPIDKTAQPVVMGTSQNLQVNQTEFTRRDNWDLVAPNLQRLTLNAPNVDLCRDACAGRKDCEGYTYVKPGLQGPQAVCYLKGRIQKAVENGCCVSGAKVPPPYQNLAPGSQEAIANQQKAAELKSNLQQFMQEARMRLPEEIAKANQRIQVQQNLQRLRGSQELRDLFQEAVQNSFAPDKQVSPADLQQLVYTMATQAPSYQVAGKAQINQSAMKVAGPKPEVTGMLTAPAAPVKNYLREGGYVLLFGRNFGNQPGKVMLSFFKEAAEFSKKKPEEIAVTLEPWEGSWNNAWQDTMVVAKVPILPSGFSLMSSTLTMWRDGNSPMRLDLPVQLIRKTAGVHSIKATPEYGDHLNRNAAVFGGELMFTGESFGDQPGKIYLELTQPIQGKTQINLLPGKGTWAESWHDRFVYTKIPDLKLNVPTQTAMLVIEPAYGGQGTFRRPISFGPRMVYALVTGEEFLDLDRDAPDNWTDPNPPYLRVHHGPDCTWYRWFGSDGTDHFFRNKSMPGNSRVVRAMVVPVNPELPWTTWETVIEEIGNLVNAFFGNPFDMAKYFAQGFGMAVGSLFDRNVGKYKAVVTKMPDRNNPQGSVRWYTTCLSFHPAYDLPIVYISSFLIEGPAGFCPGEIVDSIQ